MGSVNKIILLGHLGRDPELRSTPGGQQVANFTLATNEQWTDKGGQKQERTEWHRIVAWGKLADLCRDYLSKGRQVYIEGRLTTRQWDDKDGNKRSTTEVVAQQIVFLGGSGRGEGGGGSGSGGMSPEPPSDGGGLTDDDIPF